jgi:hypothetical protein
MASTSFASKLRKFAYLNNLQQIAELQANQADEIPQSSIQIYRNSFPHPRTDTVMKEHASIQEWRGNGEVQETANAVNA